MPDLQPIVDAASFYLYITAISKIAEPVFATILLSILGWAAWKVIRWVHLDD